MEAAAGMLLGLVLACPVLAVSWLGALWDRLWFPGLTTPSSGVQGPIQNLCTWLAMAVFAALDGFGAVVRVLYISLLQHPPGSLQWPAEMAELGVWWRFWALPMRWMLGLAGPVCVAFIVFQFGTALCVRLAAPHGRPLWAWLSLAGLVPLVVLWSQAPALGEAMAGHMVDVQRVAQVLLNAF